MQPTFAIVAAAYLVRAADRPTDRQNTRRGAIGPFCIIKSSQPLQKNKTVLTVRHHEMSTVQNLKYDFDRRNHPPSYLLSPNVSENRVSNKWTTTDQSSALLTELNHMNLQLKIEPGARLIPVFRLRYVLRVLEQVGLVVFLCTHCLKNFPSTSTADRIILYQNPYYSKLNEHAYYSSTPANSNVIFDKKTLSQLFTSTHGLPVQTSVSTISPYFQSWYTESRTRT